MLQWLAAWWESVEDGARDAKLPRWRRYGCRLLVNVDSLLEGIRLFLLLFVLAVIVAVGWAVGEWVQIWGSDPEDEPPP